MEMGQHALVVRNGKAFEVIDEGEAEELIAQSGLLKVENPDEEYLVVEVTHVNDRAYPDPSEIFSAA